MNKFFFPKLYLKKKLIEDENIKVFYPKNSGCLSHEIIQGFQNSLFYSFFIVHTLKNLKFQQTNI